MKIKELIEEYFAKHQNQKTSLYYLVIVLCIGIGIIITVDSFKPTNTSDLPMNNAQEVLSINNDTVGYDEKLERRLTEILNKIQNVGRVSVMITLKSTDEKQLAQDSTTTKGESVETSGNGVERNVKDESTSGSTVLINGGEGATKPIIVKELSPEIEGVIIVADGAKDPEVKRALFQAVETVLGIPVHRISVFERN